MPTIANRGALAAQGYGFAGAAKADAVYVEDVFSTYLYNGTGTSQTITNGIDLSTKGGMVWFKGRSGATDHALYDTVRGATYDIGSNLTTAQTTQSTGLTAFGTTGYTIGALAKLNTSAATYASWAFRKQAKFFDIVSYTGTGSAITISHSLGCTPGMIIVKRTDATANWKVYHSCLGSSDYYYNLNTTTDRTSDSTVWNSTSPTSSVFSIGTHADVNASGGSYIAYLFADSNSGGFGASGTDSIVACGSFTGQTSVSLGWEPQYLLIKNVGSAQDWFQLDTMRRWDNKDYSYLSPDLTAAETLAGLNYITPTANGFKTTADYAGLTYIYLAIRRGPMKTPTDATKVFAPVARTGTGIATSLTGVGFPPDIIIHRLRSFGPDDFHIVDKVRGNTVVLTPNNATAETATGQTIKSFDQDGISVGSSSQVYYDLNLSPFNEIYQFLRRAPGFFDVVCATAAGSTFTVSHNLGVAPEIVIWRNRNVGGDWNVYHSATGNTKALFLNYNMAPDTDTRYWNATSPTASVFTVGSVLATSGNYVAYLFATCPGVSKVGSYTGTGAAQNIACGFASGARYVLIKRTDSTGHWYVWDSARGINASGTNDPYLLMSSNAAEVASTDYLGTYSAGFALTSSAPADLNASGGTYTYLAIA